MSTELPAAAGQKILVVDDEPHIVRIVKLSLEKAGYQVVSANCGEDAIEMVSASRPNMVILDVMMPSMDGFAVCQHIRKLGGCEHIPIIFLTARGQSDDLEYARSIGANDLMTKPFGPRQLIDLVAHYLASVAGDRKVEPAAVPAVVAPAEGRATEDRQDGQGDGRA